MEVEKETGLKGKVALVTGANHGIGAATAQTLAAEGVAVFITYLRLHQHDATGSRAGAAEEESVPGEALYHTRQAMSAEQVVQAIRERGGRAVAWEADLANPTTIPELFDRVEGTLGPVDVLVNNAAIGYLSGGSTWDGWPSRYTGPQDVQIPDLIADLA